MPRGRGFGNLQKGERVTSLSVLHVGDVLLDHSNQFDADNTVRVTHVFDPGTGERVWVLFVNPDNTAENWGVSFAIWDFELEMGVVELYQAIQPPVNELHQTIPPEDRADGDDGQSSFVFAAALCRGYHPHNG